MYEYITLTPKTGYIDCPAKVGIVKTDGNNAVLIDGGSDKDAGKKVLKALKENGLNLTAIYNTHSHADHIGGNLYLQEQTGCKIFANGLENAFVNNPFLEPVSLYGGNPVKGLDNKFLLAKESLSLPITEENLPEGFSVIPLPGHSPDMVGFITPDNAAFIGDSLCSKETLEKYAVGYTWDAGKYLESLEKLKTLRADIFISAHAPVTDDISSLIEINIASVNRMCEGICSLCAEALTFEEILKGLFDTFNMTMSLQQYALIGSTLRGYLSYLYSVNRISFEFDSNRMLWKRI